MKNSLRFLVVAGLSVSAFFISSCGSPDGAVMAGSASYMEAPSSRVGWAPSATVDSSADRGGSANERPGLGTSLGQERTQSVRVVKFFRRSSSPDAVASFHYNDEEGAKAMAQLVGKPRKRSGVFSLIDGNLKASLNESYWSGTGDEFPWYESGGKVFVIGERGDEYAIVLQNATKHRAEFVVSVDGRDVIGGEAASAKNRGYIVEPRSEMTIKGFRSGSKVRSFRFGGVNASHANQAGGEKAARNVGVVGVAVFYEDDAARRQAMAREGIKRDGADAFPQG